MHESIRADKTGPSAPRKPGFWTDSPETSWNKLERRVNHEAVAFAYGASRAFHDFKLWGREVKALLKADWKETGHDAHDAWDKIRSTAKRGWDRASGGPRRPQSPLAN